MIILVILKYYNISLTHLQAFIREGNNEGIQEQQEVVTKPNRAILTGSIERDKENRERYHELGDNIAKSERLRVELTKGIRDKKPIDDLLLIALECIATMTGYTVGYKQNIDNLESRP